MQPRGKKNARNLSDDETSDSDSSESMTSCRASKKRKVVPQKKRGRPRKTRSKQVLSDSECDESMVNTVNVSVNSKSNKNADSHVGESSAEKTPDCDFRPILTADSKKKKAPCARKRGSTSISPKKRGRPRMTRSQQVFNDSDCDKSEASTVNMSNSKSNNHADSDIDDSSDEENPDSDISASSYRDIKRQNVVSQRKRGRPKTRSQQVHSDSDNRPILTADSNKKKAQCARKRGSTSISPKKQDRPRMTRSQQVLNDSDCDKSEASTVNMSNSKSNNDADSDIDNSSDEEIPHSDISASSYRDIKRQNVVSQRKRGRPKTRSQQVHSDSDNRPILTADSNKKKAQCARKRGSTSISPKKQDRPRMTRSQQVLNDLDCDNSQASTVNMSNSKTNNNADSDIEKDSSGEEIPDSDISTTSCRDIKRQNVTSKRKRGRPRTRSQQVHSDVDNHESEASIENTSDSEDKNADSDKGGEKSSSEETPDSDFMPALSDSSKKKKISYSRRRGSSSVSTEQKRNTLNHSHNKHSKISQGSSRDSISFKATSVESLAQKCVYFLIIEDKKKYAIKKKAILTHVFKDEKYSQKFYQAVLLKANSILRKTFAIELIQLENQKDSYMLINILKREFGIEDYVELTQTKQQQHGLILYLLTVIYMNGNCITENELAKALKPLELDLLSTKPHPVFGDIKKYITTELVRQMYLDYKCVNKDPPQYEITWGLRAKEEVDKKDLLQFVCQVMDDTTPEQWILQYKDAEESAGT